MKLFIPILIIVLFLGQSSCGLRKKQTEVKSQTEIVKNYDNMGRMVSTSSMKDGKRDGITTVYYKDGKVSVETNYINDVKTGIEKKYYENGAIYRTRQFQDGKMNGEEKRYYRDGTLMTLQTYKNNMPANDLKEYYRSGNLIKKYPRLIFKIIKNRDYEKQKLVLFYFEDKSNPAQFYEGKLLEGKYFDNSASPLPIKKGVGEIVVYNSFTGKITISAKMITQNRAPYVLQEDYFVTAEK